VIPWLRLTPYLAGLAVIVGLAWWLHHRGYEAGQAKARAHYEPILAAIDREKVAAETRVKATQAAAQRLSQETEERHAHIETVLQTRAAAAERRLTGLLRELTAARDRHAVPPDAGTSPFPEPAPEESERIERVSRRLAGVATDCEADAQTILEFQRWYAGQRALLNATH
jgi:hypothetical protein